MGYLKSFSKAFQISIYPELINSKKGQLTTDRFFRIGWDYK